jgi:APA family basic amino acid/polyamine antiporter
MSDKPAAPLRVLGVFDASMLVVGSVIGAGIFLVGGFVAESVGSPGGFLGVWLLGGAFALAGALCNGELGGMFPRGGGEYVYLREAYGPALGFLSGWTSFWIGFPGSIATLAAGFGRGVTGLLGLPPSMENLIGLATVALLTALNVFGLRPGKWVQNVLSVSKLAAFAAVLLLGLAWGEGHGDHFRPFFAHENAKGLAVALVPIYFAYSGWNAATYVAGEMKDAKRDLGRALALGTATCTALYLLVNAGFLNALGLPAMRGAHDIAGAAASQIFGRAAGSVVTGLVVVAVLSSLQASIVVGPRIYHAMAEDGLFPGRLARLSKTSHAPAEGIVVQGVLSAVLLLSGQFEALLNFTTFALCLFSIICVLAVPVLRLRRPHQGRPFKTPGYPFTPLLFILGNGWVLWNLLASGARSAPDNRPSPAIIGLGIVLTGLPGYFFFSRKRAFWSYLRTPPR